MGRNDYRPASGSGCIILLPVKSCAKGKAPEGRRAKGWGNMRVLADIKGWGDMRGQRVWAILITTAHCSTLKPGGVACAHVHCQ